MDSSYDSGENEVLFVKIGVRVQDLWLDLMRLLGPSGPNVVSRHQTPRSRIFLRFHNFIGFIFWCSRKWGLGCENMSWGSGLISPLGPNCSKLFLRHQTPDAPVLEFNFFMLSSIKLCMKQSLIFKFTSFLTTLRVLIPRKLQKNLLKILLLVPFQICKVPKLFLKNLFFILEYYISNICGTAWPN